MTDVKRGREIARLEKQLVPPGGTPLSQVEAVYGPSTPSGEGMGVSWRGPNCRSILLLSFRGRDDRGTELNLKMSGDVVERAWLFQGGTVGGFPQLDFWLKPSDPGYALQQQRIQEQVQAEKGNECTAVANDRWVSRLYWWQLRGASWNK